jgi:hypothetical protein
VIPETIVQNHIAYDWLAIYFTLEVLPMEKGKKKSSVCQFYVHAV